MMLVRLEPAAPLSQVKLSTTELPMLKLMGKKIFTFYAENFCLSNSDSFTILGLWVLGLAVSNINES